MSQQGKTEPAIQRYKKAKIIIELQNSCLTPPDRGHFYLYSIFYENICGSCLNNLL